jgi:hypothetical protein
LHNGEFHDFTPHQILLSVQIQEAEAEAGRACCTYEVEEKLYGVLVGKPEGQRPLGKSRHRWEDNIEMDLKGD